MVCHLGFPGGAPSYLGGGGSSMFNVSATHPRINRQFYQVQSPWSNFFKYRISFFSGGILCPWVKVPIPGNGRGCGGWSCIDIQGPGLSPGNNPQRRIFIPVCCSSSNQSWGYGGLWQGQDWLGSVVGWKSFWNSYPLYEDGHVCRRGGRYWTGWV